MTKTTRIKAVDLTREIRDRQAKETAGKTTGEKVAYYRAKAQKVEARRATRVGHSADSSRSRR